MRRHWWIWLGLAGLVSFGCVPKKYVPSEDDRYAGSYADAPTAVVDSLVAVSYNIKFAEDIGGAVQDLRALAKTTPIDLLLLQEMDPAGTEAIADSLGYHFVYFPASIHPYHDELFGNAVLSKWPIVDSGLIPLPHEGTFSGTRRVAVVADIQIDGNPLRAISVHTATMLTSRSGRLEQAEVVVDSVSTVPGPIIVAGDFNTVVEDDVRELRRIFRDAGYRHARLPDGSTIRGTSSDLLSGPEVLDHIFYRGLQLRTTGIQREADSSDHYPVWASFDSPYNQRGNP